MWQKIRRAGIQEECINIEIFSSKLPYFYISDVATAAAAAAKMSAGQKKQANLRPPLKCFKKFDSDAEEYMR